MLSRHHPPRPKRQRLPAILRLLALSFAVGLLPGIGQAGTFHNNYPGREPQAPDLLRWAWERMTGPAIAHDPAAVPWQAVDLARLASPPQGPRVTWLGHATVLIEVGGLRVLTDPFLTERASPLGWIGPERRKPLPLALTDLPHIDVVLISHNHHDHLDPASLLQLARQPGGAPRVIVPQGDAEWLSRRGVPRVEAMSWWQQHALGAVTLTFVPVQHWSRHFMERGRDESLWGGYVLAVPGWQALFAGDTGYSQDFHDIRQRLGAMDLALLPIGAYQPRWLTRRQHIDPAEAMQIHQDLGARMSLGIHWGTLVLSDEPVQQPQYDLATARQQAGVAETAFPVWAIGETREFTLPAGAAAKGAHLSVSRR